MNVFKKVEYILIEKNKVSWCGIDRIKIEKRN
jgi:hypothetical protein